MTRLPTLAEVTYAGPNPDGKRKCCSNCGFFANKDSACLIHPRDVKIKPLSVCGYHIPGTPIGKWAKVPLTPLNPKYSGLELTKEGTSCDICNWYDVGRCKAVSGPSKVQAKGCCTRWLASK